MRQTQWRLGLIGMTLWLAGTTFAQGGDDCDVATPIFGTGSHSFDSSLAIPSTVHPSGIAARWFDWTATTGGWFHLSTCDPVGVGRSILLFPDCASGSDYRALFNCPYSGAGLSIFVQAGERYRIAVEHPSFDPGTGTLRIEPLIPVDNDECVDAQEISGRGPHAFDQTYTTPGLADPACAAVFGEDVWFVWQAPFDGYYEIEASYEGSSLAPYLSLQDGCGLAATDCANRTLKFWAESGASKWIRLSTPNSTGSFTGTAGDFTIELCQPTLHSNGHAYFSNDIRMTWTDARADAESQVYGGVAGHLATVTTGAENDFLSAFGGLRWIGFYRSGGATAPFEWVTGEPVGYTNWLPGRPDSGPLASYTVMAASFTGQWDDETNTGILDPSGYGSLVEWDLDLTGVTFCDPATPNSTEYSTELLAQGSLTSPSGVRLEILKAPPGQFGYFLVGSAADPIGIPIQNGQFCLGTGPGSVIGRYNFAGTDRDSVGLIDSAGHIMGTANPGPLQTGFEVPQTLPLPGNPTIQSGQTWHFQFWHREDFGESNFSNGLSVTF